MPREMSIDKKINSKLAEHKNEFDAAEIHYVDWCKFDYINFQEVDFYNDVRVLKNSSYLNSHLTTDINSL